jgi:hypothetical protein
MGKNYVTATESIARHETMADYYDYVLGFVPSALVVVTATLNAAGVAFPVAMSAGAAVASLALGHAVFVNGPSDELASDDARASEAASMSAD